MASKKKATSRSAAQPAVKKKWHGSKVAARSSSRKAVTAKTRKASARLPTESPAKSRARAKQRVAVSHHREEDFKADGLRAYAKYRDLGI